MSNTAELFQPECEDLTVPAGAVIVRLDGELCEDLAPVEIVRGSYPEFGWARLAHTPRDVQDAQREVLPETVEDRFAMGRRISLHQLYNRRPLDAVIASCPLFVGWIEGIETTIHAGEQRTEIVAKDYSACLGRRTVFGQRLLRRDGSTVLLDGQETVFNPLGQPNASPAPVWIEGRPRTIFSAGAGAKTWTGADAIRYLLSEYVPADELYWPDVEQLLAMTESRPLRDLDVTGLDLLEALHRCCDAVGIRFQFAPRLAETGPAQAIVFHRDDCGRRIELGCQPLGEALGLSRTNIGSLRSERAFYPVTHRYIGQGDFKIYEATFELVKAWDPALEGTSYRVFCPSTNPEFYKVKDVYRKWCLNEAGDYSVAPYNQGEPYDFSRLFDHADYAPHRRRFRPALSTNAQGTSLGYYLQVSYDDGLHWRVYPHAFNNLLDECGVWLSSDQLDIDMWVAALKHGLRMRITASVVSDERLTCIVADGPVGSTIPVVDHVLTLPRQFAYRKVSAQSLFARPVTGELGIPDEADDSAALRQFVRRQAVATPAVIETIDVQTPTLRLHLHPGDTVASSPESRDLLSCRRDNRSVVRIERVHMDLRNQCTNLHLVRERPYDG